MNRSHARVAAVLAAILPAMMTSGCATVLHGTTQSTQITSDPPGATAILLPTGKTLTTPATVTLARKNVYTVLFSLEGYEPMTIYVNKVHSDATVGNVLVGGLVGITTDYSNGAAWNLHPNPVHARLVPLAAHEQVVEHAPEPVPSESAQP